ncbi:hypothetical protein ACHQM5_002993 [Ranunculus cassubicifolius]
MAHSGHSSYVIFHPENLSFIDIINLLRYGTPSTNSVTMESSISPTTYSQDKGSFDARLKITGVLIFQKILIWLHKILDYLGDGIVFFLNCLVRNGGIFQIFSRYTTGSFEMPQRGEANYRSMVALIDGRSGFSDKDSIAEETPLVLCCKASNVAYENKEFVQNVVSNGWNAHFVGFYEFWNGTSNETQAFICCDSQKNAKRILLAFRGTSSTQDISTDVDYSWISFGDGMGRVHAGFMKALGFDVSTVLAKKYTGEKKLAYYSLRDTLETLLQKNKDAELFITGHSLGGALAILFPALLLKNQEYDLMSRLCGIYTFGQPRVGDKDFAGFMMEYMDLRYKYHRVVFRYDIVARVPCDIPRLPYNWCKFVHFGRKHIYYRTWHDGQV